MEIFIDLAQIAANQADSVSPGFDLNLLGLLQDKTEPAGFGVLQNQLKTTPELSLPDFDPALYFLQIQEEFNKIKATQQNIPTAEPIGSFQEAQANSASIIDSFTAYLEQRFNTIETLTNNSSEISQLIQGQFNEKLNTIQSVVNSPLNQVTSIEQESSVSVLSDVLTNLVNTVSENPQSAIVNQAESTFISNQVGSPVTSNQLVNTQDTNVDLNSQNISNLSETVSNFASNIVNGIGPSAAAFAQGGASVLANPTKNLLPVSVETPRPDFAAASLSALMQMADSTQTIASAPNILNTTTSQSNTTMIQPGVGQTPQQPQINESPMGGNVILGGASSDNSSIYLMQMLNLMKSGQIKVKIH